MADKMMRIAGRDSEGLAKAVRVDQAGNLVVATNNPNFRRSRPIVKNEVNNLDGTSYGSIIETDYATVIDSITLTFNDNINGFFHVSIKDENGVGHNVRVYRPNLGSFSAKIRPVNLDTENNGQYVDLFELVLYDEINDVYVIRNRKSIYAPFGINIRVLSESTGAIVATSVVAREVMN